MIKLSDYIFKYLTGIGVTDLFMISGGGAMHLVDSVGQNKKLKYVCPHHEQAAASAAEGYTRASGKMGVVVVTSGPGGTNALTGVIGQWLDSIPCLYLSGQVKFETTIASQPGLKLRQLGDQEINIVDIVKPVTKYAVMVTDPKSIRYHLEKAIYLATQGRPGPVWLDLPLNVQAALIDERQLRGFKTPAKKSAKSLNNKIKTVIKKLKQARRPVIVAGHGIRLAGAPVPFRRLIDKLRIPVVTTFNGFDLLPTDDQLLIGHPGTIGDRAGNFAVQNADFLLELGSRNNIRQVSYNWPAFAREAYKVVVDIDQAELDKPTVKAELPISVDVNEFLTELNRQLKSSNLPDWRGWLKWCQARKAKYPVVSDRAKETASGLIEPYSFVQQLTQALTGREIIVAGNGTACVVLFQAGIVKQGERIFWNSGCASMGYDLPAAIGASIAAPGRPVICLAGDGSLQMNIQELQTVAYQRLPLKLFVLNNYGYISIKQTQDAFFGGHRVACCPKTGVSCPDIIKVAAAYGLKTAVIADRSKLQEQIKAVLSRPGPLVIEVRLEPTYQFQPKLSSARLPDGTLVSKPLEDMFPFLPREEFRSNLLIKEWPNK